MPSKDSRCSTLFVRGGRLLPALNGRGFRLPALTHPYFYDEKRDGYRLICLGITDEIYTYSNNLDLADPTADHGDRGTAERSTEDDALIEEIGLLTLKTLMAIYSSSGVAEEQGARPTPTPGMSRRQQQRLVWEPSWIGKNYGVGEGRDGMAQKRRSPRMHFRRGHTRRVPCGKQRLERKVVRIPFKIVMGKGVND